MNVDYENIQRFSAIECAFCGFLFRNKTSLKHHIDSMHNGIKSTPGQRKRSRKCTDLRCMEKGCTCKFYNKQLFISHLKFDHQIDFDIRHLNFTSVDEYSNWKENFESEKNCRYVRVTGCKTLHDGKKLSYYYCNRSTYFTSKSKGVRKRKNPIRVKGLCTASMKEIENIDGSIEVLLCATHYGHDTSSEHMKMTKREREEITELIQQGDHPDQVINAARAKAYNSLGRMHMLNRKDIKNIERKLGIRYPQFIKPRRINDLSTDRWISKLQLTSDNPIVFYKPQNVVHESFEFNDLILIFMTSNQQYWINTFGSDGIFMVTEMKMIRAGFYLTVLYVCDEFNVMLPVCFMMCNDSKVYQTFFLNAIYNKIGPIYAKALITDDNYDLYECWTSTMTPVKHIINQRYIDDQIIDKLQNEVEDQGLQHEIYDKICSFFNNPDISTKEEIINYSKNYLTVNDETKKFGMFFDQMFTSRANMWAFCYLKESLDLDKMIDIDTIYNQMLLLCENKNNFTPNLSKNINIFFSAVLEIQKLKQKKIEEININISNNHRNAACYNSTLIFPIGKDMWRIKLDDRNDNEFVTVTRKFCKIIDCTVKCQACYDMCAHIYECSCNKGEVNICEHVHMLGIFSKRGTHSIDNDVKKEEIEILDLRMNIVSKLKRILTSIHCVNDEETLRRISVSLSRTENNVSKAQTINDEDDEDDYYYE